MGKDRVGGKDRGRTEREREREREDRGREKTCESRISIGSTPSHIDLFPHLSVEVLTYLLAQKLRCPNKVFLVRGNHEMRAVNGWEELYKKGSFLTQCKKRYGTEVGEAVWEAANECFDRLPLAAVVDNSVFCVHGGIPRPHPDGKTKRLDMIRSIPSKLSFEDDYEKEEAQEMMDEDDEDRGKQEGEGGHAAAVGDTDASPAKGDEDDDGYVSPTPETERKLTEIAKTLESKEKAALEAVAKQERQKMAGQGVGAFAAAATDDDDDDDDDEAKGKGGGGGCLQDGEDVMAAALLLAQRRLAFNLMWSDPAYAGQEPDLDADGFGPGVRGEDSLVYGVGLHSNDARRFALCAHSHLSLARSCALAPASPISPSAPFQTEPSDQRVPR